jgi:hypothetical protein
MGVLFAGIAAGMCAYGTGGVRDGVGDGLGLWWSGSVAFATLTARIEADGEGVRARVWGRTRWRSWEQLRAVRRNGTLVVLVSDGVRPVRVPLGRRRRASRAAGRLEAMVRCPALRPVGPGEGGAGVRGAA